ncbi:hypothetical protein EST38_g5331 [Candolleomyces aberdarensis]|uniref:Uncharacterized protein n=1 Tax=Candolleomyces aberdarensis TaxID=2316362 RepID=A0A4Q2DNK0_9AGAR|nr:hypothetical protein EST38_g5331 [Candolleomyces aberdarensis]
MSAETDFDFEGLRTKLRAKCVYLADDGILERLEWFETLNFEHVVLKDDVDNYKKCMEDGAPPGNLPQPARLAGIFRISRRSFFMRACGRWKPDTPPLYLSLEEVRPSAYTADPGIPELEGDYPKSWENVDELLREWYRSQNEDEAKVSESRGVIDRNTKKPPNPANGFKIGRRVFEKRSESPERLEDHGPRFSIENWPVEFSEAQPYLDEIKSTHIAHPIPVYYPDPENDLIPPDRYYDDLPGAIVRLEFHLNHYFIGGRHTFAADIMRMKVLVRPSVPPPSPKKRKGIQSKGDFSDEDKRSPKRQAVSSSTDANVPQHGLLRPAWGFMSPNKTKATLGAKTPVKAESAERHAVSSSTGVNVPQPKFQASPSKPWTPNRTKATRGAEKTPVKTEPEEESPTKGKQKIMWLRK